MKKVCVIGAGVSGLVATKTCLEEGLEVVCLERSHDVGGVWLYKDKPIPDRTEGQLYNCLVTNSSKMMLNFSDFPFSPSDPPYMPWKMVNEYYAAYADHFKIRPHIRFNTEVTKVEQAEDYELLGRWSVTSKTHDGNVVKETYDALMLCTGLFSKCNLPWYPGQDEFKGQILHSNEFRKGEDFVNKTVLVIGGSHSAGDVAVDSSFHAKQVYLSTRHGAWVLQRNADNGVPRDMAVNSRFQCMVPFSLRQWLTKNQMAARMSLDNLGLLPTKELFHSEVMVNDIIDSRIMCGKIKAVTGLERFIPDGVVLIDGSTIDNVDVVVYATGYQLHTPFLDDSIMGGNFRDLELYLYVFPPRLRHPTFAAIGFFETIGSHGPVMELQARWACRVFKGLCNLPSQNTMLSDVRQTKQHLSKIFGKDKIFFPPVPYSERVSSLIGAKPNILKMAFTDPLLAYKCFFGPAYPFTYRLQGPNSWDGAREAIMTAWDYTILSTKTRETKSSDVGTSGQLLSAMNLKVLQLGIIFLFLVFFLYRIF